MKVTEKTREEIAKRSFEAERDYTISADCSQCNLEIIFADGEEGTDYGYDEYMNLYCDDCWQEEIRNQEEVE